MIAYYASLFGMLCSVTRQMTNNPIAMCLFFSTFCCFFLFSFTAMLAEYNIQRRNIGDNPAMMKSLVAFILITMIGMFVFLNLADPSPHVISTLHEHMWGTPFQEQCTRLMIAAGCHVFVMLALMIAIQETNRFVRKRKQAAA